MSAGTDFHRHVRFFKLPGVARLQPAIAQLLLPAILEVLVEHTELITDAVADGGDLQAGQRIQVAGREPAQAAIAQARFLLMVDDLLQIKS